jgi:hypothetical protein
MPRHNAVQRLRLASFRYVASSREPLTGFRESNSSRERFHTVVGTGLAPSSRLVQTCHPKCHQCPMRLCRGYRRVFSGRGSGAKARLTIATRPIPRHDRQRVTGPKTTHREACLPGPSLLERPSLRRLLGEPIGYLISVSRPPATGGAVG